MNALSIRHRYLAIQTMYSSSVGLFGPTWVLALQARGFSWFAISLVIGIGWTCGLLLEIPTGMFADRYGRRNAVTVGCLIRASGLMLWAGAAQMAILLVGAVMTSFGETLCSGALDAWMVDASQKRGEDFSLTIARGSTLSRSGGLVSGVVGAFVLFRLFGASAPFSLATLGLVVVAGLAATWMDDARAAEGDHAPVLPLKLDGARTLLPLTAAAGLVYAGLSGPFYQWQIAVHHVATQGTLGTYLSVVWIGIGAVMTLASIAGKWLSTLSTARLTRAVMIGTAVNASAIVWAGLLSGSVGFFGALFLIHLMATAGTEPGRSILANRLIANDHRATALSTISAGEYLGAIAGLVLLDVASYAHLGIPVSWVAPAALMFLAIPALAWAGRRLREERTTTAVPVLLKT